MEHIIVWDPSGQRSEGTVVDDLLSRRLAAEGIILLPINASVRERSGVGCYHRRETGDDGALNGDLARMQVPMTVFGTPDQNHLGWAARLEPVAGAQSPPYEGAIRIAADSGQPGTLAAGIGDAPPFQVKNLAAPDAYGGWIVTGRARVRLASAGHYGVALYGRAPGLRVVWAAVSLA